METIDPVMEELPKNQDVARDFYHSNDYELVPYLLRDGQTHPFAIICPGGAYSMVCSYVEGDPFARKLNALGFHAFVVYYHVREHARFPGPQNDLARAVKEVFSRAVEWNLDTHNYSVWGSSAGGHLAASFGTGNMGYPKYDLPKPGALVLIYPVITMGLLSHTETRTNLLGPEPNAEDIEFASVERQITSDYPPTFLWSGDSDTIVSPENSRILFRELRKNAVPCLYREYPGIDHGAGLGTGTVCESWFDDAVNFWQAQK